MTSTDDGGLQPLDEWDAATAATYDDDVADEYDPAVLGPTIDLLVELAGADGSMLEFAIGTGRIALPLADRGLEVHGIERSRPMIEQLQMKLGADRIAVTEGDMASTSLGRRFDLVVLAFNTIMNLTTQDAQVACFANAARHLEPGGHFVIEVMVPRVDRLADTPFVAFDVSEEHVGVDEYDVVTQRLVSHHVTTRGDRVERSAGTFRYVWPSELDLMARLAGFELRDRWADWSRAPFVASSRSHVSVYTLG